MSWQSPYIVIRVVDGVAQAIHEAKMLKDARYYLQYIAQPGDALFQTSFHPKYSGSGCPVYQGHLKKRGDIQHDEAAWLALALKQGETLSFAAAPAA